MGGTVFSEAVPPGDALGSYAEVPDGPEYSSIP
jgi:hypothetical protein